jgi:hypothetical protein
MYDKTSLLWQENLNSDGKKSWHQWGNQNPYIEEGQTTQFYQYQQDIIQSSDYKSTSIFYFYLKNELSQVSTFI